MSFEREKVFLRAGISILHRLLWVGKRFTQFTPPVAELHLVVRKVRAGIVHDAVSCLHDYAAVELPKVAVDQAWLEGFLPAALTQRAQQPGHYNVGHLTHGELQLWPRLVAGGVEGARAQQQAAETVDPGVLSRDREWDLAVVGRHGEPELARHPWGRPHQAEPVWTFGKAAGCLVQCPGEDKPGSS